MNEWLLIKRKMNDNGERKEKEKKGIEEQKREENKEMKDNGKEKKI